jgi:hypothetical protein
MTLTSTANPVVLHDLHDSPGEQRQQPGARIAPQVDGVEGLREEVREPTAHAMQRERR